MSELLSAATLSLDVERGGHNDVECWLDLRTDPAPDQPIVWLPRWSSRSVGTVRGVAHLAVLISNLAAAGDLAGMEWAHGSGPWGQTMRTDAGWIVEVHDGTHEDFAARMLRDDTGADDHLERWNSMAAAEVMWAWLHGSLLTGGTRSAPACHPTGFETGAAEIEKALHTINCKPW